MKPVQRCAAGILVTFLFSYPVSGLNAEETNAGDPVLSGLVEEIRKISLMSESEYQAFIKTKTDKEQIELVQKRVPMPTPKEPGCAGSDIARGAFDRALTLRYFLTPYIGGPGKEGMQGCAGLTHGDYRCCREVFSETLKSAVFTVGRDQRGTECARQYNTYVGKGVDACRADQCIDAAFGFTASSIPLPNDPGPEDPFLNVCAAAGGYEGCRRMEQKMNDQYSNFSGRFNGTNPPVRRSLVGESSVQRSPSGVQGQKAIR